MDLKISEVEGLLPSRVITIDHQEYLWFGGTSYLGMAHHQGFRENLIRSIARYGTSWGSSRNNSVRLAIFEEAEKALALFAHQPAALTVSSGMWAGALVTHFLNQPDTTFYYAPKTHPALWQGNSLILRDWEKGLNYADWTKIIAEKIKECKAQNIVICSDAVGSPYTESFDFQWIEDLPSDKNISVVVDASHSIGLNPSSPIFGDYSVGKKIRSIGGKGLRIIITTSLNKALAMPGGAVFSDENTITQIRQTPMFAGASPMMPALLDAFVNSTEFYREQQQKLFNNIQYFNSLIPKNTFLDSIENYPAYCTYQSGFFEYLKENGIMTACFPYPTANDKPVTRLVVSALHLKEDLEKLANLL
jgi:8-amino-7-oxononanoate synthase